MIRRTASAIVTFAALMAALILFDSNTAMAQGIGFGKSGKPVDIESDELEINEDKGSAVFSGRVVANQDKFRLRSAVLEVFYESEKEGGATKVTSMDAQGNVVIITKGQKITGSAAHFDMVNDMVTVTGDVVVTQGSNVIRGQKLLVNQKTGKTKFVGGASGKSGRVRGLFLPSKKK